jgi:hypothetical protein
MAKVEIRLTLTLEEKKMTDQQIVEAARGIAKLYEDNDPNMKCDGILFAHTAKIPKKKKSLIAVPTGHKMIKPEE